MIKRIFDFIAATLLLVLFSPVILLFSILVYLFIGPPVFFIQKRIGHNGKFFSIVKFKSMVDSQTGETGSDDERLKPFGVFLRASSIDELPELLNVMKGDMSLVGPRPLLIKYRDRFTSEQFERHSVRPGITGWAQINGRNSISWDEKFAFDLWYVENQSFWIDIKILLLTVGQVLKRRGITSDSSPTMPEFKGNESK